MQPVLDTNPETKVYSRKPEAMGVQLAMDKPDAPWADIRVRQALQMAINNEEIAEEFFSGYTEPTPWPTFGDLVVGFTTPFEDWPEESKKHYTYDPEAARQLLTDAGYADGFQFDLWLYPPRVGEMATLLQSYLADIGVTMNLVSMDYAVFHARVRNLEVDHASMWYPACSQGDPSGRVPRMRSDSPGNTQKWDDANLDAMVDDALATLDYEDWQRKVMAITDYVRDQHWTIVTPCAVHLVAVQPWVNSFSGEWMLGVYHIGPVYARIWLDQDLKKNMGY